MLDAIQHLHLMSCKHKIVVPHRGPPPYALHISSSFLPLWPQSSVPSQRLSHRRRWVISGASHIRFYICLRDSNNFRISFLSHSLDINFESLISPGIFNSLMKVITLEL